MLEPLFNTPILFSLALTLLHFLWQGLLIATLAKLALLIIDKSKPQIRYALCAFAMLANLFAVIITFNVISPTSDLLNSKMSPALLENLPYELEQGSLSKYQEIFPSLLAYVLPYISLAWLAIVLVLIFKLLIEIRNVNILPTQGSILPNEQLNNRFYQLVQQLNLTQVPKLLISMRAEVPMAIGIFKPVVLIPATMVTGLTPTQLEMLILHELAHIRRHDYLVNFLQTLIELLFFFHPSVHWLAKHMRNEREYCSDDIAVKHCGDPIAYAHTLTDTASLCLNHQHTIPSMAMAASGGDLKQRVVRLVDHHCTPKNDIGKWFAAITLLFLIVTFSIQHFLSNAYSPRWVYHLPWQAQHLASAESPQSTYIDKNENSTFSNNSKDSIAQHLLQGKESNDSPKATVNDFQLKNSFADSVVGRDLSTSNILDKKTILNNPKSTVQTYLTTNDLPTITHTSQQLVNEDSPLITPAIALNIQDKPIVETDTLNNKVLLKNESSITPLLVNQITIESNNSSELNVLDDPKKTHKLTELNHNEIAQHKTLIANNITNIFISEKAPSVMQQSNFNSDISTGTYKLYELATNLKENNSLGRKFKQSRAVQSSINNSKREYDAKQLTSVDPVYPSVAKRKGIEIEVQVHFTIDRNGEVKDINFARQSRLNYFKSAIRTAMRKWRFMPAKVDNRAVESQMSKIFSFSLQG